MRFTLLRPFAAVVLLLCVGATQAASAAPDTPRIPSGTPLPQALAQLKAAGIEPVQMIRVGSTVCRPASLCTPGQIYCGADIDFCQFLFARRRDDQLFIVETGVQHRPPYQDVLLNVRAPRRVDMRDWDFEAQLPSGKRRAFVLPPAPPEPDRPMPLCRDAPPHTLPCWVTPPSDPSRIAPAPRR